MWNERFANFSLIQSLLCDDIATAKAALVAGASALLTLPRRTTSLLECAIRLQSVTFVDLLMTHGAPAGAAEMATLVEQVQQSKSQPAANLRRLHAILTLMHRQGADFNDYLDDLIQAQPTWFRGLHAHQPPVTPAHRCPGVAGPRVNRPTLSLG